MELAASVLLPVAHVFSHKRVSLVIAIVKTPAEISFTIVIAVPIG